MTLGARSFAGGAVNLDNAAMLITGGTGSFGRQMVRTLLTRSNLRRLVVFSRDELKQYDMGLEFQSERHAALRYFIGDVRDADRLEMAMRDIDCVIHAAALKQVPTAEYNLTPRFESVRLVLVSDLFILAFVLGLFIASALPHFAGPSVSISLRNQAGIKEVFPTVGHTRRAVLANPRR